MRQAAPPVSKAPRRKVKRFTRRLLWRERLVLLEVARQEAKDEKRAAKRGDKTVDKIDAALEGCEDW